MKRHPLINVTPTTPSERAAWMAARDHPPLTLICAAKRVAPIDLIGLTEGSAINFLHATKAEKEDCRELVERLLGRPLVNAQSLKQGIGARSHSGAVRRAHWFD